MKRESQQKRKENQTCLERGEDCGGESEMKGKLSNTERRGE